jgi:hypothetical protein
LNDRRSDRENIPEPLPSVNPKSKTWSELRVDQELEHGLQVYQMTWLPRRGK